MSTTPSDPGLTALLVENHRRFLAFLERRVGDRALAEDILQDAFVKSLQKEGEIRDDGAAIPWFYRMLRNAVIDHYRRSGARGRGLESFAREMEGAVEPPHDVREAICGCLGALAATLKPEYASAIQRLEIEETPIEAYAAEAGITRNNASVRAFRAREALRRQVKKSCGTCAEHGCLDCSCSRPA